MRKCPRRLIATRQTSARTCWSWSGASDPARRRSRCSSPATGTSSPDREACVAYIDTGRAWVCRRSAAWVAWNPRFAGVSAAFRRRRALRLIGAACFLRDRGSLRLVESSDADRCCMGEQPILGASVLGSVALAIRLGACGSNCGARARKGVPRPWSMAVPQNPARPCACDEARSRAGCGCASSRPSASSRGRAAGAAARSPIVRRRACWPAGRHLFRCADRPIGQGWAAAESAPCGAPAAPNGTAELLFDDAMREDSPAVDR